MEQFPRDILRAWASRQSEIVALFVFGSRAKGTATLKSDLDLAFVLDARVETELTTLVENAAAWRSQIERETGLIANDLYLRADAGVTGPVIEVYRRRQG